MKLFRKIALTIGLLALTAFNVTPAAAAIHDIQQDGLAFVPAQVTVAPGDTIRWHWGGGVHTVTSGTACTFDGTHFDEALTSSNPMVEYVVPLSFTGEIPYFCQPHCTFGMTGGITVEGAMPCPPDVNGDAVVDVLDLLAVLAAWGGTSGPEDVNGDGIVNVLDLLEILSAWGPC